MSDPQSPNAYRLAWFPPGMPIAYTKPRSIFGDDWELTDLGLGHGFGMYPTRSAIYITPKPPTICGRSIVRLMTASPGTEAELAASGRAKHMSSKIRSDIFAGSYCLQMRLQRRWSHACLRCFKEDD